MKDAKSITMKNGRRPKIYVWCVERKCLDLAKAGA
ncbi:hypothetical protein ACFLUB_03335 [Chloroflexota bacterium]